jgi:hypothetical protein
MLPSLCPLQIFSLSPSHPRSMRTDKAAEPVRWTILSGKFLKEDPDDSDFSGDQESDSSSDSSLESISSGDNKALAAEEREARAAEEQEDPPAEEVRAAEEEACADEEHEER